VETTLVQLKALSGVGFSSETKQCFKQEVYDLLYGLLCSEIRSDNLGALAEFIKMVLDAHGDSKWARLALDAVEIILVAQDSLYLIITPRCPLPPIRSPMRRSRRQFGLRDLLFTLQKGYCSDYIALRLSEEEYTRKQEKSLELNVWGRGVYHGVLCCLVKDVIAEET